jgi:signal transduction histidine kinase
VMGDRARQRAQPWFIATALILLLVGLLVGVFIVWVTVMAERAFVVNNTMIAAVGVFDLITATLIAASILCVGQAIALYEVFTGKVLPRRGLLRHWHNAIILALGYGVVVGWALTAQLHPIYIILLTTALLTIFYALLAWRTYVERDRFTRQLRPFVTSERLYEQLLTASPAEVDMAIPFRALCRDVLGARAAILSAVGSLAPLVPSLVCPDDANVTPPTPNEIARFDSPQTMWVQLDAARWAVPLWSERGLIGVLTLGEKSDGGMYSQEEIDIARASGERLIDTLASAELARRLMALQRQRVAETQLLDQRARRVLHDDVLPQLHAALLALSANPPSVIATLNEVKGKQSPTIEMLTTAHRQISNLLRDLPTTSAPEVARLGLVGALQRAVEEEWRQSFDRVAWDIAPDAESATRALPSLTAETLFYAAREAIRNAARHGRGDQSTRALNLRIGVKRQTSEVSKSSEVSIVIEDDGVGLHKTKLAEQGSGQGLALHSAMLAVVGGTLAVEPRAEGGTRVEIRQTTEG